MIKKYDAWGQATVEILLLLCITLVIVAGITYMILATSEGLGSGVENNIENTVEQIENLLKVARGVVGVS
jgi:uncharacterized protein (UPF0333 family)